MSHYSLPDNDIIMTDSLASSYVLRFRDGSELRPDAKALAGKVTGLNMAELVSLVLGNGTPQEDVLELSQRITKEYGEKALLSETSPAKLAEVLDIPLTKALQLVACFEVGRRYFGRQAGRPAYIRHSKQAFEYLKPMGELRKEQLRGLYLNSRYQVVRDEVISIGSLTANIVHPREIFQPAIEHGAVAVLIAHNHPSGQLSPTLADTELTERLVAAGELLGIDLIDHLIITDGRYISLLTSD